MKVALSFPGCHRRGGVERVMVECLNFLAQRGHETHAFASEWNLDALRPEVIRHDLPASGWLAAGRVSRFRDASAAAIAACQPDVTGSFGVAAAPGSVVWMQSVHAAWIDISQRTRTARQRWKQRLNPFHPMILRAEKRMLRGREYRRLIALTPQVRDDLVNYYGVPTADIDLLPNGFSRAEFNPADRLRDRTETRQRLGIPPDATVIVFVANETERKGLPQLLRATTRLADPNLYILAVGRFDPATVEKLAAGLGLGARVKFPGASARVQSFYAAADVFALPTQYEAWGLVIVEALACGLPVLTSRLAGAAVAVKEHDTGELLDEPRDEGEITAKLGTLINRLPETDREAIARSVERYEWSQVLTGYEHILRECAQRDHRSINIPTSSSVPRKTQPSHR